MSDSSVSDQPIASRPDDIPYFFGQAPVFWSLFFIGIAIVIFCIVHFVCGVSVGWSSFWGIFITGIVFCGVVDMYHGHETTL